MKHQRKEGKARKLNRKQVLDLHARGFSAPEIAQQQGVAHSTVWRFLERMKPEIGAVEIFKQNRADVLARIQAKSLDAQERIIDTLDDGLLAALTPSQKSSMLIALNAQSGTAFDKERLERGQSTANISTISRMIDNQVSTLFKRAVIQKMEAKPVKVNADEETQSK
ncbi:MAG: helix-turn-helix domain-containing protein [Nitrospira sp.]|nr:helix-turn-helix domain-containing protein [Nitrospira sp.]